MMKPDTPKFALVPIEPTEEMLTIGLNEYHDSFGSPLTRIENAYKAMLAAAPKPDCVGVEAGWQPMDTAPKTGRRIVVWVENNPALGHDPEDSHATVAYWTDHNDGGWVWHGLAGTITKWLPVYKLAEDIADGEDFDQCWHGKQKSEHVNRLIDEVTSLWKAYGDEDGSKEALIRDVVSYLADEFHYPSARSLPDVKKLRRVMQGSSLDWLPEDVFYNEGWNACLATLASQGLLAVKKKPEISDESGDLHIAYMLGFEKGKDKAQERSIRSRFRMRS